MVVLAALAVLAVLVVSVVLDGGVVGVVGEEGVMDCRGKVWVFFFCWWEGLVVVG